MAKKENLSDLLFKMVQNDEGEPLSSEDYDELIGDLRGKIDAIRDFISRCEAEAERLDKTYLDPITRRKKACLNSAKTLSNWVTSTMVKNQFPFIKGDLFQAKVHQRTSVLENGAIALDSKNYLKYKDLMKRSYSWDKKALSSLVKSDPEKYKHLGTVKNTDYIRFSVVKGEKK